MPSLPIFGDRIDPSSVGDRQVPSNPTPRTAPPPIQLDRWFRNGMHPDANALNMMAEAANQSAIHRCKQVFGAYGRLGQAGVTGPIRWRFAFRTGAYHHALLVAAVLLPNTGPFALYNHSAKLTIYSDTGESTAVVTETMSRGPNPHGTAWSGSSTDWSDVRLITRLVTGLSPDTEYYARWEDVNFGKLQSACVVDLQSLTENNSGYLGTNAVCMTPVVDTFREKLASIVSNVWKKNAAHLFNWGVDDGTNNPISVTSSTPLNVVDTSISTISAASPGFTLDGSNRFRLSQSGVPIVMKACGMMPGAGGPGGKVYLRDSAGNTIASIENQWAGFSSTPEWFSTTGTLPDGIDKYDLQIASDGTNTFELYAVSVYAYES